MLIPTMMIATRLFRTGDAAMMLMPPVSTAAFYIRFDVSDPGLCHLGSSLN